MTREEKGPSYISEWKPETARTALHSNVMVYAQTRIEGTWSAYIFPVPGINHDLEEYLWERDGNKIAEVVARALFPQFKDLSYDY